MESFGAVLEGLAAFTSFIAPVAVIAKDEWRYHVNLGLNSPERNA